jgi:methionyl-tRNA formyltransferase
LKLGLFASKKVGHEIAKFLGEKGESLNPLVVDENDAPDLKNQIIEVNKRNTKEIYTSKQLEDRETVAHLKQLQPDIIILGWWPYIIKGKLFDLPKIGWLNFHPSYLPYGKGKDPNFWAIRDGSPYGVSLHFIDKGIDTGDIVFQKKINVGWVDSGKTLYNRAVKDIVELFKENFDNIKTGKISRKPQDKTNGSFHQRKELNEAYRIFLDKRYLARDLLNIIRARTFPPYPGAWFEDKNEKYEIEIKIKKKS